MPGSVIFVVIVAIWAAYLIQHWVRRREHLATARSVDKFSEAMRVLERRSPLPASELATPRAHSYNVKLPSARPAVVVKRAASASAAAPDVEAPVAAPSRSRRGLWRKVRGVALLVTLLAIPVTAALSALHVLRWLSVGFAFAAFVVVLGLLVASARRERAAKAAARRTPREAPLRADETTGRSGTAASGSPARRAGSGVAARAEARPDAAEISRLVGALQEEPVARVRRDVVFDDDASPAPQPARVSARAGGPSDASGSPVDGEWSPVPVPPPTYTLKEPAARRTAGSSVPMRGSDRPVPIDVDDWAPGEGDDLLEATRGGRREASGG